MHALTLRGVPGDTLQKLKEEAREHGFSMNKWVCSLLSGRFERKPYVSLRHGDLDHLFGTMSQEDCDALDEVVRESRTVDKELWA